MTIYLPHTQQADKEVRREARGEHLRQDVHVRRERALQHDGHVARVEELDGVRPALAAEAVALHRDLDAEALEVDDDGEDDDGREQIHQVRQAVAPERLAERAALVVPREEEVEERDDGALEFGAAAGVDGRGREGLPDDGLADVRGNEEGDAGPEAVALLEELIEEDDDEGGRDKLDDEQQANTRAKGRRGAVEARQDVDRGLTDGNDQREHYCTCQ